MQDVRHEDAYVQALFDRMEPTYALVNTIASFGFSVLWRRRCVARAEITAGQRVCDMMAGSGECWNYILARRASLVSVDFSPVMSKRQAARNRQQAGRVDVRCENALQTTIESASIDCVVSAFGLKTLDDEALRRFAHEIHRILKPGGRFSLLEISTGDGWWLAPVYRWYLTTLVPRIGKLCLGDIECYRMLGAYTCAFGSCARIAGIFHEAGLDVAVEQHFHGCATSLIGSKRFPT